MKELSILSLLKEEEKLWAQLEQDPKNLTIKAQIRLIRAELAKCFSKEEKYNIK